MLGKPEKVEEGEMRKSGELKLRKEHDKDIAQDVSLHFLPSSCLRRAR